MNPKAFKNVQETIFTVSVILMVALSVIMTYTYLQSIPIPTNFENHITGSTEDISSRFAECAVACYYTQKNKKQTKEDCYILHIRTKDTLTKESLLNKIPQSRLPHNIIQFSDSKSCLARKNTDTTFKITYDSFKNKLLITKLDGAL
ncbi:MAG: hypothetical protein DRN71_03995 [Candidatus Nanohalarchaeota archaeon]|nr:MAG: hypothetical protein DRN71_03995 [Candidatus Nanohaloarchaeota archaeon]